MSLRRELEEAGITGKTIRNWSLLILLVIASIMVSCNFKSVEIAQGQEAVFIKQPKLAFAFDGGVHPTPGLPGRTYVAESTRVVLVNMQRERETVDFKDVISRDGVPLDFHVAAVLQVTDSVRLIRDFGAGWFKNNVESPLATAIRQSVRKHGMNETAIDSTAIDAIDSEVREAVSQHLKSINIPIALRDISVGKANPPDSIKTQRLETAVQEQRINTERQGKLAEDERRAREESRAAADNAYAESINKAMNLTPSQYLQLEQIKMLRETCGKEGSCNFFFGAGSIPLPTLAVK